MELWLEAHWGALAAAMAFFGLLLRLRQAVTFYLNPDEAWYFLLAGSPATHGLQGLLRASIEVAHPPLFVFVLRTVEAVGRSELLLRLIPVLAGTLFPVFVMLWVRRFAGTVAGLCSLALLLFSPALIGLSTEVRGYTLAFLFTSVACWLLEEALNRSSGRHMAACHVFLYLAILTEYCVVWAVGAVGIYGLCRMATQGAPRKLWIAWSAGQAGGAVLYALLFSTQVSQLAHSYEAEFALSGWLRTFYWQPGSGVAAFLGHAWAGAFRYFWGSASLSRFGAVLFLFGVCQMWKKRSWPGALLLVAPFCLAGLGALLRVFPLGASRHSSILVIFMAVGTGTAVSALARDRIVPSMIGVLAVLAAANAVARTPFGTIPEDRHQLSHMRDAVDFLRTRVPAGSMVVTDRGTDMMLSYYLGSAGRDRIRLVPAMTFDFENDQSLREAIVTASRRNQPDGQVWVAAAGFEIRVTTPVSEIRPFSREMTVFQWKGE